MGAKEGVRHEAQHAQFGKRCQERSGEGAREVEALEDELGDAAGGCALAHAGPGGAEGGRRVGAPREAVGAVQRGLEGEKGVGVGGIGGEVEVEDNVEQEEARPGGSWSWAARHGEGRWSVAAERRRLDWVGI